MKIYELKQEFTEENINVKAKDLIKFIEEGIDCVVPHLPTYIKDELTFYISGVIMKNTIKVKEPTPKKKTVDESKNKDKEIKSNREEFDKKVEKELDELIDLMGKILKIERGN